MTVALANGQTEAWGCDGHTSSVMLNRYRRQARTHNELALGVLAPLKEAIPELRPQKDRAGERSGGSGESEPTKAVRGRNRENPEPAPRSATKRGARTTSDPKGI